MGVERIRPGITLPGDGGEPPSGMEARIAKLESDVGHINETMAGIRSDLRDFANDTNENFREVRKRQHRDFVWLLSVIAGLGLLMAKGFGWLGG